MQVVCFSLPLDTFGSVGEDSTAYAIQTACTGKLLKSSELRSSSSFPYMYAKEAFLDCNHMMWVEE